jgi:hypothetical protein
MKAQIPTTIVISVSSCLELMEGKKYMFFFFNGGGDEELFLQ